MTKILAYGNIKDGKLTIRSRRTFDEELKSLEGREVVITVERYSAKRSTAQNALWWVYMGILSKELGYTKEQCHDIAKFKFLKRELVDEKSGEIHEYLKSTTKLTKLEFSELVDNLIIWAAELNIVLPPPNTQLQII